MAGAMIVNVRDIGEYYNDTVVRPEQQAARVEAQRETIEEIERARTALRMEGFDEPSPEQVTKHINEQRRLAGDKRKGVRGVLDEYLVEPVETIGGAVVDSLSTAGEEITDTLGDVFTPDRKLNKDEQELLNKYKKLQRYKSQ